MTLSTSVSTPYPSFDVRDTAQNVNAEIQNLLLEVLPNASPHIQLENFFCALIMSNTVIKIDFLIDQNQENSAFITNKARQDLFIFTCAFIIGFSERFASDLLKKTESNFIDS
ncbi:MAG: hypothetical protein ACK5CA_10450 [Cyanobacteriota bacterium]|jgi:hypothetical protein